MPPAAKSLTTVALIRGMPKEEPARTAEPVSESPVRAPQARPRAVDSVPIIERTRSLAERWNAPVMTEEEIEAWATRYRLCPKSGMSFLEYLIARGVGAVS